MQPSPPGDDDGADQRKKLDTNTRVLLLLCSYSMVMPFLQTQQHEIEYKTYKTKKILYGLDTLTILYTEQEDTDSTVQSTLPLNRTTVCLQYKHRIQKLRNRNTTTLQLHSLFVRHVKSKRHTLQVMLKCFLQPMWLNQV